MHAKSNTHACTACKLTRTSNVERPHAGVPSEVVLCCRVRSRVHRGKEPRAFRSGMPLPRRQVVIPCLAVGRNSAGLQERRHQRDLSIRATQVHRAQQGREGTHLPAELAHVVGILYAL